MKESFHTCNVNSLKYTHDETATVHVYPSSVASPNASPWSLNARVQLESTSTLVSPSPLFYDDAQEATGTPFSQEILHLLARHKLQRLLLRVGDAASFHGDFQDDGNPTPEQRHRSMGPSGTSIAATFVELSNRAKESTGSTLTKEAYQSRYATLLRHLLDHNLFPSCGAPLDSIRERKHGHSILVHSASDDASNNIKLVEVESVLAADGATFCTPGINFLLANHNRRGWGAAANNGACHPSDNWGLFDSLFGRPVDGVASNSFYTPLSDLLLGTSLDSNVGRFHENGIGAMGEKRHSIWVDAVASPECFLSNDSTSIGGGMCRVEVTRGVSYRIALPSPNLLRDTSKHSSHRLSVTLGDLLLGRNTLERSISTEGQGWKAWYPCPLSNSSKFILILPNGYEARLAKGGVKSGKIEMNALAWKDGYMDLADTVAELYRIDEDTSTKDSATIESRFGISRSVQRPLGIAGGGTLVTVVRYSGGAASQSPTARVESFDVLPGHLIKPRMHTLRMALYQGDGAGDSSFVPLEGNDREGCAENSFHQRRVINRTAIALSDLKDDRVTLHRDGTIVLERTMDLAPDSSLWMMVDYDEAYLPFQKFPADANRGVDVFPSRATFTPIIKSLPSPQFSTTVYSSSLLLLPPVPDMSMPFNVISLSCTLWAFVLGSMINILVRRSTESIKRELTGEKEKRPLDKLKEKIFDKHALMKSMLNKLVCTLLKRKVNSSLTSPSQVVKEE
ncbi:hypothetical protein HJC23_008496 [Cyclotella cryptica]|uniref:GPI transamidase component PIG-T n=1 Tax=Cyclotella cryptica TaxID=29204 RepID=A0ABD3QYN0_9STRA|eukprot:CCRYP_001252-RA/>CCRYP_001252-RA protein AED:0.04 eAED:0.04 QI:0/-1/0/1/-1/1/1/0/736